MSKMGSAILEVQQIVDEGIAYNRKLHSIISDVRQQFGEMFTDYAEDYYYDFDETGTEELHNVDDYESLLQDLDITDEVSF